MSKQSEPRYWRSVDELRQNQSFVAAQADEFVEPVEAEQADGSTRRHFLGVMGASMAMASLSGCVRRPVDNIVPYSQAPESVLPGIGSTYATATSFGGRALGLLVESHEGRPTKIEGNPGHASTGRTGATGGIHQAMILDLYDPARMATPLVDKKPVEWSSLADKLAAHFKGIRDGARGSEVAVIAESLPSLTLAETRKRFKGVFAGSTWYTYESVSDDAQREGLKAALGEALVPSYRLNKAAVLLAIDSDVLGTEGDIVQNSALWAPTRDVRKPGDQMSRLYSVEALHSITGTNADHRLRLRQGQIESFVFALTAELAKNPAVVVPEEIKAIMADRSAGLSDAGKKFAVAVAADLTTTRDAMGAVRSPLIVAGPRQSALVHAVVAILNKTLGAQGTTVHYYPDVSRDAATLGDYAGLAALKADLDAGKIKTLVVLGGNPLYAAPGSLELAKSFERAEHRIVLADHLDETAKAATIAIPRAHFLETWGDVIFTDGTVSIQQPLIAPLRGTAYSEIELLARLMGDEQVDGYSLVRGLHKQLHGAKGFHKAWRRWLHEGVVEAAAHGAFPAYKATQPIGALIAQSPVPAAEGMDLLLFADANVFDGRFANNSWLQEAPDPLTKITWDNAAILSPATAEKLGIGNEDRVRLEANGKSLDTVAWILPGLADDTIAMALGYGRDFDAFLPYHDKGVVGFDTNPLRSHQSPFHTRGAKISKTSGTYGLACVQRYGSQDPDLELPENFQIFDPRPLVRETSLEKFNERPDFAKPGIIEHGKPYPKDALVAHPPAKSLYRDVDYSQGHQWAMVIDLNKCTGCNACLLSCQAENNIMSVGKDQVRRGREMSWIRMDRYFVGDLSDPQVVHQPLACMHCETAPCENVCPVAATVHSPEGTNDMAYNRCIGTRYCANNCPFKVRRFNFYNYAKGQPELFHMQRNPNVTVRFRGVMEKCTYCIQRVNQGKRRARLSGDATAAKKIVDGILSACQQTCPTGAIVFGDQNDASSKVAEAKALTRDYGLLTELNLKPRTSYLAKVRNPNPQLVG